ncbi:ATP-dependent DNA helicase Q-like 1 [Trametes pubescens]|uniref:DNA 3'-5' helicase n=1 Tax=Trametes pubescens TaxID=154538 RepID=A0A1M2V4T6_TRAPU|nr:ATP-dependent DNA helicase Q-like 1 [Trametes pubescens]
MLRAAHTARVLTEFADVQDIESCLYRVVVVNPEQAFKSKGGFSKVWRKKDFTSRVISVVWDEAHCIFNWASFRTDYGDAGRMRNLLSAPFHLPSATMPDPVFNGVLETLNLERSRVEVHRRSNDRPNVYLTVRKMHHAARTYQDLVDVLLGKGWKRGDRMPFKSLTFFDSIEESLQAADVLRKYFAPEDKYKLLCFNSDVTAGLREAATEEFKAGKLWGLYCTDSFGMGVDIADIELIVQWKLTCDMDSLWQRIGRAARGPGTEAVAVIIAEPKHFDEEKEAASKRAEKRAEKRKETEVKKAVAAEQRKRKRAEDPGEEVESGRASGSRLRPDQAVDNTAGATDNGSSGAVTAVPVMSECEKLRIEFKSSQAKAAKPGTSKAKKGESGMLSPELDNMVNAATRSFRCYRIPVQAYYENDRVGKSIQRLAVTLRGNLCGRYTESVSDSHRCLPNGGNGCARCLVSSSTVCCSLCTPTHPAFSFLPSAGDAARPSASRASHVDSKYTMNTTDIGFRRALHDFRRAETLRTYGRAHLNNMGPGMIMGDGELSRIADCARARKLGSLDDLYKESKWDLTHELGERVLELVTT